MRESYVSYVRLDRPVVMINYLLIKVRICNNSCVGSFDLMKNTAIVIKKIVHMGLNKRTK